MFNSFLKFLFGFTLLIILGMGVLALTSYAAPFFKGVKAGVFEAFK